MRNRGGSANPQYHHKHLHTNQQEQERPQKGEEVRRKRQRKDGISGDGDSNEPAKLDDGSAAAEARVKKKKTAKKNGAEKSVRKMAANIGGGLASDNDVPLEKVNKRKVDSSKKESSSEQNTARDRILREQPAAPNTRGQVGYTAGVIRYDPSPGPLKVGERIRARWKDNNDEQFFNATVTVINHDNTLAVLFEDGDRDSKCPASWILRDNGCQLKSPPTTDDSMAKSGAKKRSGKGADVKDSEVAAVIDEDEDSDEDQPLVFKLKHKVNSPEEHSSLAQENAADAAADRDDDDVTITGVCALSVCLGGTRSHHFMLCSNTFVRACYHCLPAVTRVDDPVASYDLCDARLLSL